MFTSQIQHLVEQITDTLTQLTDEEYSLPLAVFNGSSIGQHTRHVIEFFVELDQGYSHGFIHYDNRKRNKLCETDKSAAISMLQHLALSCTKPDQILELAIRPNESEQAQTFIATTYYRELAFAIEHTVHHMALLRIGIEQIKSIAIPADFGIGASTQHYQSSCAQ